MNRTEKRSLLQQLIQGDPKAAERYRQQLQPWLYIVEGRRVAADLIQGVKVISCYKDRPSEVVEHPDMNRQEVNALASSLAGRQQLPVMVQIGNTAHF